jgi:hypothetical protein
MIAKTRVILAWAQLAAVLPFLVALAMIDVWRYPRPLVPSLGGGQGKAPRDDPAGPGSYEAVATPVEEPPQPRLRLVR